MGERAVGADAQKLGCCVIPFRGAPRSGISTSTAQQQRNDDRDECADHGAYNIHPGVREVASDEVRGE